MVVRNIAVFTGGAVIGAVAMTTYFKSKETPKPVAVTAQSQLPPVPTTPVPTPTPTPTLPQVPSKPAITPPPVVARPPPTSVGNPRKIMPHGFPGPLNDVFMREGYVASYNRQFRHPNWVAEHITVESLKPGEGVGRGNSTFKEDDTVPDLYKAKLSDYFRSGYDRGHMVPAADCKNSQTAMDETFYLSNIAPQVGEGFNRDYWAHFENFCRVLAKRYPDVYVITGPLYLPYQDPTDNKYYIKHEVIGNPPNIGVPTHFYKVILTDRGNGDMSVGAFVLPNNVIRNDVPLTAFQVPVEAVEKASGLKFFETLERRALKNLCKDTDCKIMPHPKSLKGNNQNQKALPAH
ncbi:nuclease [Mortierella hygrophila]|uniref:Endonuclease n=1 Tax=Mortierella hygrophila TaxID=979708 RepID=A0A9P6F815_9FUNG|nr:nuclease [Mortierella hygrophila]